MYSVDESRKESTLTLKDRATLAVDGVFDALSFDESAVILDTSLGTLTIEGSGLHILSLALDEGRVTLEGNVSTLFYSEKSLAKKGGFLSRLFR